MCSFISSNGTLELPKVVSSSWPGIPWFLAGFPALCPAACPEWAGTEMPTTAVSLIHSEDWEWRGKLPASETQSHPLSFPVELLVAAYLGPAEGACRECPGCCKHFLAKCRLGFSPSATSCPWTPGSCSCIAKGWALFWAFTKCFPTYTHFESKWPLAAKWTILCLWNHPLLPGFVQDFQQTEAFLTLTL